MKKTYALAFASGVLLLGSCASDAPVAPNLEPIDEEGNIGYIRIDLPGTGSTRALDEIEPDKDESEIEEAAFIFYVGNNQYYTKYARKEAQTGDAVTWVDPAKLGENHEGKCAIIKLPQMPLSVAVVCNGEKSKYEGDLTDENTYKVSKYAKGDNKLFYMSSARYWNESFTPTNQTPITADMIFKTKQEAEKAVDADGNIKAVKINVEHYVAKVNVKHKITDEKYKLDDDGNLDPQAKKEEVNAIVTFHPEYTFLTATSTESYTIKKIPLYSPLDSDIKGWSNLNDPVNRHSSWLRLDAENPTSVKWPTLDDLKKGKMPMGHKSLKYGEEKPFYAFDNRDNEYGRRTSVVICGKYRVYDKVTKADLADPVTGSFWLVAFEDKFEVYSSEEAAIKAMGGAAGDKLVPDLDDDASWDYPGNTDARWTDWTGWMKIENKDFVTRCIKYNGGYGYYAKPILHYKSPAKEYEMVVRNHYYDVTITGIAGMGVGIPSDNDPIVPLTPPDPSKQDYYMHMSVQVAPWRSISNDVEWQ